MFRIIAMAFIGFVYATSLVHAETKRIALVLPGPITDGTFNSAANKGIEMAKEKYDIEVAIRENTDFAQIVDVLRSYADEGYDMIIGHGFQFGEPVLEIHKEYPDTWFVVNTSNVSAEPNVASFDNRWGDAGYIAGAVAALYSETGTIGHIGAIPVPVIEDYNRGFALGAKYMRSDANVLSAYVGSFTDVARGAEITTSLIEKGADVVTSTGNENVVGTIQAAQRANVKAIGTAFDSHGFAPETIITTVLINMDVNIDLAVGRLIDGTLKPESYVLGLEEDGIGLAPFRDFEDDISAEDMARIRQLLEDIEAKKIDDLN